MTNPDAFEAVAEDFAEDVRRVERDGDLLVKAVITADASHVIGSASLRFGVDAIEYDAKGDDGAYEFTATFEGAAYETDGGWTPDAEGYERARRRNAGHAGQAEADRCGRHAVIHNTGGAR